MPLADDQEHVLVLSGLFNIALNQPDDPEFPSLGIFECMAKLILRGINDREWLRRDQNVYIPYYAAHIIGSYTMNKVHFAEKAIKSGVVLPLMELLRGKMSWVEQRVAVRALGHLASHERTFEAVALHEVEIIELAKEIACNCFQVVYEKFLSLKEKKRVRYHCDLLTKGLGGLELESRKAEEWASQLQCWSLHLLNCFACKERSLNLICCKEFLKIACNLWGGLANHRSPAGIGLIRTLCHTQKGRERVASLKKVIENLCNVSRSSDDWQYLAIDCLLLLLKDPVTRYQVIDSVALFLVDLVELKTLRRGQIVGEAITQTLLQDYHKIKYGNLKLKSKKAERAVEEVWDLKVEKRKKEKLMPEQELKEKQLLVGKLKQEGNEEFWSGHIEKAAKKYTEALDLCTVLKMRKERVVLYSNRAQCYLLLKKAEAAISDTTRAICLSSEVRSHSKSLWRRSQAYDMKGLAKESLVDCLTFISSRMKSKHPKTKPVKIPYYAAHMINKQMNATCPFNGANSKTYNRHKEKVEQSDGQEQDLDKDMAIHKKNAPGLPTNSSIEELLIENGWKRRKAERAGRRRKKGIRVAVDSHKSECKDFP
ncbi:hypothetical protein Pint_27947 [Pistacia integerrima]|uniref:Uncharacterized protein n=1 Tax=Pistacia integerrima TaxID=434235 RepID=A0ACC0YSV2_9ROSI|nr:hypothetical protein Pint_27947 [Pistacia integerrima]